MSEEVDLLVPINALDRAKSRLRGAADGGAGDSEAHIRLTLALARDTVRAARAASAVRRVFVISPDPRVLAAFAATGARVVPDRPDLGLNAAARRGVAQLQRTTPGATVGVLHGDLPALKPAELDAALAAATQRFATGDADQAFCPDAAGSGTTLLVCGPEATFRPRFGPDSAAAYERIGALRLDGAWPGLRRDVDTVDDLRAVADIGPGPETSAALAQLLHP